MHSHSSGGHHHGIDMSHPVLALSTMIVSISVKEGYQSEQTFDFIILIVVFCKFWCDNNCTYPSIFHLVRGHIIYMWSLILLFPACILFTTI